MGNVFPQACRITKKPRLYINKKGIIKKAVGSFSNIRVFR